MAGKRARRRAPGRRRGLALGPAADHAALGRGRHGARRALVVPDGLARTAAGRHGADAILVGAMKSTVERDRAAGVRVDHLDKLRAPVMFISNH